MKTLQKCFLLAVAVLLVVGLVRTLYFPKEINDYENRYASQFPAASTSAFLDGSFQDEAESSLSDQIPFSQYMKKAYNNTKTSFLLHAIHGVRALTGGDQGSYASFNGLCLYGDDFITNWPRTLSDNQADLDRKSAVLNQTFANHPELTFWVYYVEKDTDMDFFTQEKAGFAEYLMQHLDLPDSQKATYTVDDFDEFSRQFFRTDTHWNLYGSYAGYRQLFDVLHCTGTPLEPTGDPVLVGEFSGGGGRCADGAVLRLLLCVPGHDRHHRRAAGGGLRGPSEFPGRDQRKEPVLRRLLRRGRGRGHLLHRHH